MFTLGEMTALLSLVGVLLGVLPPCLSRAAVVPEYTILPWDKSGDLLVRGSQCPNASQCFWYHNVQPGILTRVSDSSTLDLKAQNSEYDEYYLMNADQNKSAILQYALVVPNANAGSYIDDV